MQSALYTLKTQWKRTPFETLLNVAPLCNEEHERGNRILRACLADVQQLQRLCGKLCLRLQGLKLHTEGLKIQDTLHHLLGFRGYGIGG